MTDKYYEKGGVAYDECPNCGCLAEADGIHNGIGYIYPPLHCDNCGWSEHCYLGGTENCTKQCTEWHNCAESR